MMDTTVQPAVVPWPELQFALKRGLDVFLGSFLLILLAPVLLASCIAIRLTSPGKAVFSQLRWGLNESRFHCLKLRTMYVDQSRFQAVAQTADRPGMLAKLRVDPRVTAVGRWLRKTSIDEFPQLLNVIRGEMSLVGPRPLVLHMLEPFPEIRRERCRFRPGITGLWQIRNREKNTSVLDMWDDDLEYIQNFSLWLDVKTLLATLPAVLSSRGAH
jgi:lipopolysaccharide/colanic/teichoic acid biosynthesis glycosyltransferase